MMTSPAHLEAVLRCVAEIMSAREATKKASLAGAPITRQRTELFSCYIGLDMLSEQF